MAQGGGEEPKTTLRRWVSDVCLETSAVYLTLAEHTGAIGGIIVIIVAAIRYGSDAVLRLVAGLTAMFARNEARASRALVVLAAVRQDQQRRPGAPSG
jgi:hypothetical protein